MPENTCLGLVREPESDFDEETLKKCRICLKLPGLPELTLNHPLPKSKISIISAVKKTFNFDVSSPGNVGK